MAATTRPGLFCSPLRSRFGILLRLEFYTDDELRFVVERSAEVMGVPIDRDGAAEIAMRSRGTPSIANRLLRRVRDYAQVRAAGKIDVIRLAKALELLEVDAHGFDELDRRLLRTIIEKYDGGPVGLNTLAAALAEEQDALEEVYEPFLIQIGFLDRTPRGRVATRLAYEHLGIEMPRKYGLFRAAIDLESVDSEIDFVFALQTQSEQGESRGDRAVGIGGDLLDFLRKQDLAEMRRMFAQQEEELSRLREEVVGVAAGWGIPVGFVTSVTESSASAATTATAAPPPKRGFGGRACCWASYCCAGCGCTSRSEESEEVVGEVAPPPYPAAQPISQQFDVAQFVQAKAPEDSATAPSFAATKGVERKSLEHTLGANWLNRLGMFCWCSVLRFIWRTGLRISGRWGRR